MTAEPARSRPASYVGARVLRVEDPRFLTGRAGYLDDIELPNALHAAFVRSPHAHARILSIDVSRATAIPGVVAVFTGADLADLGPIITAVDRPEVTPRTRTALAVDKVRHVGDAIAVVVAHTRYLAEDGVDAVDVDFEVLPAVLDPERALDADAPVLDEAVGHNNFAHIEDSAGDVEGAFTGAAHVFSKRFRIGRSTGAPLETRGVMADYDPGTGRFRIWSSSQVPHLLRTFLAPVLKVPEGKINVTAPDLGGGFGVKCQLLFPEEVVIPAASRLLRRPVKWIEDRYENLAASVHSKAIIADVDVALDAEHTFLAFRGRYIADGGGYATIPWTPMVDVMCAATMLPNFYDVRNVSYTIDAPLTNKCPVGAVRGVGWMPGQLARETLIDDVARQLDVDPIELRVKNAIGPEPYESALGAKFDGGSYVESMRLAQKAIGYDEVRERQERLRAEGRYIGIGFSAFVEPTGLASKGAAQAGYPMGFHDRGSVSVDPDGSVTVTVGLHSHGQGHETVFAQLAADQLGVRIEDVRVVLGDSDQAAYGMGTYASRSAVIGTGAIKEAAGEVRAKLQYLAGALLEASPDDVELYDGAARVRGVPDRMVPIATVAGFGYFGPREITAADGDPTLAATRSYEPPQNYANGTCAVLLEVDVELGNIAIEKIVAVEDCGVMLNPMIVEGQVAGAVVQGLGAALLEELSYGEDGQFLSGSLMDYLYPTATDTPPIQIEHIETPSSATASGVKGVGEAGTIGAPAAVVNAIADAMSPFGITIDRTPVTPSYLRDLLRKAQAT